MKSEPENKESFLSADSFQVTLQEYKEKWYTIIQVECGILANVIKFGVFTNYMIKILSKLLHAGQETRWKKMTRIFMYYQI